jgi:hypothetical protein
LLISGGEFWPDEEVVKDENIKKWLDFLFGV